MKIRRSIKVALCVAAVVTLGVRGVQTQGQHEAARAAAEAWAALVDQGQYEASWKAASSSFRAAVPQQKWADAAQSAREPLGALKTRTVKSSTAAKTLPGAPDGEYVVLQFATTFDKKSAAVETITTVHEPDGQWRVVGYFVK